MIVKVSGNKYDYLVEGATIRITNRGSNRNTHNGVVTILPKVQMLIGTRYDIFMQALNLSRLPLAFQKHIDKGEYEVYCLMRLETGNICEAVLGYVHVYRGLIVAYTYDTKVVKNKEFRQFVQLSAAQQLRIPASDYGTNALAKAVTYVSALTKIPREKLIVIQTSKTIKVKMKSTVWDVPLYYVFVVTANGDYRMSQVAYDFDEMIKKLEIAAPDENTAASG